MLIWLSNLLHCVSSGALIAISMDRSTGTLETRWSALWFSMLITLSWSFWCTGAWDLRSVFWTVVSANALAINIRPQLLQFRVTGMCTMAQAITSITSTQLFWTLSLSQWCLVLVFLTYSLLPWSPWSFSISLRRLCFTTATCSHLCMTNVSTVRFSASWSTHLCSSWASAIGWHPINNYCQMTIWMEFTELLTRTLVSTCSRVLSWRKAMLALHGLWSFSSS